jgi:hypothetical protein
MALKGSVFTDQAILKFADEKGTTVAHIMATNGHKFTDLEILNLKNDFGSSVQDFQGERTKSPSLDA